MPPRSTCLLTLTGFVLATTTVTSAGPASADDFHVSQGQLTFDAEGIERPGHALHSRRLHWPGGQSGVTVGRGYDMRLRTFDEVFRDFKKLDGMTEENARAYAKGAGKRPQDDNGTVPDDESAEAFVKANRARLPELTPRQQKQLFENTYPEYVRRARQAFPDIGWETVHPAVRDVLVDFAYRGDTAAARRVFQGGVGSPAGFARAMADRSLWPGVPCDRFYRRSRYLRESLNPTAVSKSPPSAAGGPQRIFYDESQPKGKPYKHPAAEKIGMAATRFAQDAARRPADARLTAAEFVRQLGRAFAGRKIPELDGDVANQFGMLKTSPLVTPLWVPERLSEAERERLRGGSKALDRARQVANAIEEARRRKETKEAARLASELADLRSEARKRLSCLEMALRDAQERANAGELVLAVWPAGGRIAWLVPTRGADADLTPAVEWGYLRVPHAAFTGGIVTGYAPLSSNLGRQAIDGLALFALPADSGKEEK